MEIKEWAELNGLSVEEFQHEMLTYAAVVGCMMIDASDDNEMDTLSFKTKDDVGDIELYVRRTPSVEK